jgi:hypothetical protein
MVKDGALMTAKLDAAGADRLMCRLLLVKPARLTEAAEKSAAQSGESAFNLSLAFAAVRCVIKYILLPFVLPVLGVATNAAAPITLAINVVAIGSIIYSIRRFWQIGYVHRWRYLGFAGIALLFLVAFVLFDLGVLR